MKPALAIAKEVLKRHPISVEPFAMDASSALAAFEQYQATACKNMQVGSLIRPDEHLMPNYIPYWAFKMTYTAKYTMSLGSKAPSSSSEGSKQRTSHGKDDDDKGLRWSQGGWHDLGPHNAVSPLVRVCASYLRPRDLVTPLLPPLVMPPLSSSYDPSSSAAALSTTMAASRPLSEAEAQALMVAGNGPSSSSPSLGLSTDKVGMEDVSMSQGCAWHLALRILKRHLLTQAAMDAQSKAGLKGSDAFRDLQVDVEVHQRSSSVHLLPIFVASYEYGTRYKSGTHGVIVPHRHTALIGAGGDVKGRVVATPHISALKTGGLAGGLVAALGTCFTLPLTDLSLASVSLSPLLLTETAVSAVIAATAVGSWAKGLAQESKNKAARKQSEEDTKFYAAYDRLIHRTRDQGPIDQVKSDFDDLKRQLDEARLLWLWAETDWRRWEAEEPWNWDPKGKRREAESLWRRILARPLERQKVRDQRRLAAERVQQDQEEAQMGGSKGGSKRQRRFPASVGPSSQGPRDFLGYYKLLGIDISTFSKGSTGQTEMDALVKQRFKMRAMELHPDRQAGKLLTEEEAKMNNVQFQKLQIAYETLRDVEKRNLYDKGQMFN